MSNESCKVDSHFGVGICKGGPRELLAFGGSKKTFVCCGFDALNNVLYCYY